MSMEINVDLDFTEVIKTLNEVAEKAKEIMAGLADFVAGAMDYWEYREVEKLRPPRDILPKYSQPTRKRQRLPYLARRC